MSTKTSLPTRILGTRTVSAIGLGAMPMSIDGRPIEARSIATIHAALDAGVTLIDTADAYCLDENDVGHNESLITQALRTYDGDTADVVVATKGGHTRDGGGWQVNVRPEYLLRAAEASRERLDVEAIALYQFHRPDPHVPYADSISALQHLLNEGVAEMVGISNANVDQIAQANEMLGGRLASVQNQFSPGFRSSLDELRLCADLGIAFLPWSPLGGISGAGDLGTAAPAFQKVADAHGVSPQRVALAWQLALAPVVIPIPGASKATSIEDSARAVELDLTEEEMAKLGGR